MIAAYRKGRSSTELTLNNLLALQGAIGDTPNLPLLAQIDEDKEKYFDRISTELQLLPFHILGFPTGGYTEWIAESLSDVKIHTNTPFGTCINSFDCGVRQGSALSCTIANMVGWLSATAWISPPPPQSLSSSTTDPTNPHSGYRPPTLSPNPIDSPSRSSTLLLAHTYCDDASRYLSAPTIALLFQLIQNNLTVSGYMSIVNKLGVRADKSCVRLYNIPPGTIIPRFYYTAWNHGLQTVTTASVPTEIHFTDAARR